MRRYEWIAVLKKAKELSAGKNATCFMMFDCLLEAFESLPVHHYYDDERTEEEEEDEE